MVPLSTAVAGAASVELTLAVLENDPVAFGVTDTEMAGKVAPAAIGTVPVYEQDTNCPVTVQVQLVPEAAVGVSFEGKVSLTTTV
jgi:hypothetical protein